MMIGAAYHVVMRTLLGPVRKVEVLSVEVSCIAVACGNTFRDE